MRDLNMGGFFRLLVITVALMIVGCAEFETKETSNNAPTSQIQHGPLPVTGLGAYTSAHAANPSPPDLIGGSVSIKVSMRKAPTMWNFPGTRQLDPSVFGTPSNPIGWEKAPFPLVGIEPGKRQKAGNAYTIVDQDTPFSNWFSPGEGNLEMILTDATAIDGAKTKDKISFVATFQSPDKKHNYRVEANTALPHGKYHPTFGGVVTGQLLHGATGLGTRLMPTSYAYVAFWAKGKFFVDGELVNNNHLIHMMITEGVIKEGELKLDGGVNGVGKSLHLILPPYQVGSNGAEKSPLKTKYVPFPEINKRLMAAKKEIKDMPANMERKKMENKLRASEGLMMRSQASMMKAMRERELWGQPSLHVIFANPDIKISNN
ncbi:MAG: hypothetical protein ACQ9MH_03510 [Nitrospinales bacterium]